MADGRMREASSSTLCARKSGCSTNISLDSQAKALLLTIWTIRLAETSRDKTQTPHWNRGGLVRQQSPSETWYRTDPRIWRSCACRKVRPNCKSDSHNDNYGREKQFACRIVIQSRQHRLRRASLGSYGSLEKHQPYKSPKRSVCLPTSKVGYMRFKAEIQLKRRVTFYHPRYLRTSSSVSHPDGDPSTMYCVRDDLQCARQRAQTYRMHESNVDSP
jgi:hypothetical protein